MIDEPHVLPVLPVIYHRQQPTDTSCVYACIAMLMNVPVTDVIDWVKKNLGKNQTTFFETQQCLTAFGLSWSSLCLPHLCAPGYYMATVPSLNMEGESHVVIIYFSDFVERIYDPNEGREGKKFYVTQLEESSPALARSIGSYKELVYIWLGGRIPE